jgi:hypothetical protein
MAISDYADYAAYKTNKVRVEDRKLSQGESLKPEWMKRSYKYIDSLGEEYMENVTLQ